MDDTTAPVIDLNIDPDMITPQGDTPQMTQPVTKQPPASPTPGIIDITPGSTDTFPSGPPLIDHIGTPPFAEVKTTDITPPVTMPEPETAITPDNPVEVTPTIEPIPVEVPKTPTPTSVSPQVSNSPTPEAPLAQSSPLVEDPDLVELIK